MASQSMKWSKAKLKNQIVCENFIFKNANKQKMAEERAKLSTEDMIEYLIKCN